MRAHSAIENNMRWRLDGQPQEGRNREQAESETNNFSVILSNALDLLKYFPDKRASLRRKQNKGVRCTMDIAGIYRI